MGRCDSAKASTVIGGYGRIHVFCVVGVGGFVESLGSPVLYGCGVQHAAFTPGDKLQRVFSMFARKLVPRVNRIGDTGRHQAISDTSCAGRGYCLERAIVRFEAGHQQQSMKVMTGFVGVNHGFQGESVE